MGGRVVVCVWVGGGGEDVVTGAHGSSAVLGATQAPTGTAWCHLRRRYEAEVAGAPDQHGMDYAHVYMQLEKVAAS